MENLEEQNQIIFTLTRNHGNVKKTAKALNQSQEFVEEVLQSFSCKTKCSACSNHIIVRPNSTKFKFAPLNPFIDSAPYEVPFFCPQCGSIKFPIRALHDYVFIYPLEKPKTLGTAGILIKPEGPQEFTDFGIVLTFGPGYYRRKSTFVPIRDLEVGMKVIYDKTVPWELEWRGNDNKLHLLKYMTFLDVKLVSEIY